MSSPLAVGDCIAIAGLVLQAIQGLSTTHGAASKYKQISEDIQALIESLKTTEIVLRSKNLSNNLDSLTIQRLNNTILGCGKWLRKWSQVVDKYNKLQNSSSNRVNRIWLKLRWTFLVHKDIHLMRATIQSYIGRLSLEASYQILYGY